MDALVVSPSGRATRLLIRLVRIAFLLSLSMTVAFLFVRHVQRSAASGPGSLILLCVASCVVLAMIALRTDLAQTLTRRLAYRDATLWGRPAVASRGPIGWNWLLPWRGQLVASLLHVLAALCWGVLSEQPIVLLLVTCLTIICEAICWLPLLNVTNRRANAAHAEMQMAVVSNAVAEAPGKLSDSLGEQQSANTSIEVSGAIGDGVEEEAGADEEACELDETIDEDLVQFQERRRSDQRESIQGLTRVSVGVDQRTVIEHVVFHPPLEQIPEVEVEWLEGNSCQIRVARAETFGIRFELRLSQTPTCVGSIVFQYLATANCQAE